MSKTPPPVYVTVESIDQKVETLSQMIMTLGAGVDELKSQLLTRMNDDINAILEQFTHLHNGTVNRANQTDAGIQSIIGTAMQQNKLNNMNHDAQDRELRSIGGSIVQIQQQIADSVEQIEMLRSELDTRMSQASTQLSRSVDLIYERLGEQKVIHSDSGDRPPAAQAMIYMQQQINELLTDNKRIRSEMQLHVDKQHKFNRSINDRVRNLEILVNSQDDTIALLRGRIKALESDNVQEDILSERSGEAKTPETRNSDSGADSLDRIDPDDIIAIVQRWLNSTPDFFRINPGEVWAVPNGVRFQDYTNLEWALLSAAERLRRHRLQTLRAKLGAYGPGSDSYPRLEIQRENALKESDKS